MVVKINKNKPKKHLVKHKTRKNKTRRNKTRRNKTRKSKYGYKYRIYSGGVTPVSPISSMSAVLSPQVNATPLNVSPVDGSAGVNPADMSVLPLGVQAYAYNRNTPYRDNVISAKTLEGQKRLPDLTDSKKIHSWGNEVIRKSPIKIPTVLAPSAVAPIPEPLLPPPPPPHSMPPLPPPTPPKIALTSTGRLKTTYTPKLDVIEFSGLTINKKSGSGTLPLFTLLPFSYTLPEIIPLSFLPKRGEMETILGPKLFEMLNLINTYSEEYFNISPRLYSILKEINKTHEYGVLIIWGKLRDELFENIAVSSIDAIQSRTLFDEETTRLFMDKVKQVVLRKDALLGPSPSNPYLKYPHEMLNFTIPAPKHPPKPTSLQIVGYNTHPMFNRHLTRNDELRLLELSEENNQTKPAPKRETIFILAHGGIGNELSSEIKILANKYLRVIELGKMHELLSAKYNKVFLNINNILLDPNNAVMFNNTTAGENKRKEIFDMICKYLNINKIEGCLVKNTLSLTNLTHDRVFSGHYNDTDIIEDHDINLSTISKFYSMGVFIPVDYKKDKSKQALHKKTIFELYPETAYFTTTTTINMIETLLPIAIRENKIMNILIFSCAPKVTVDDKVFISTHPHFQKPGTKNPAIKLLMEGKKFLYNLNRMFSAFIGIFFHDSVAELRSETVGKKTIFTQTYDYFPVGRPVEYASLDLLKKHLNEFYMISFERFLKDIENFNFRSVFSFAGIGSIYDSYDLIETYNPAGNTPYANELIKVKIYLMEEFYSMLSPSLAYFTNISNTILRIISYLSTLYTGNTLDDQLKQFTIRNDILQATNINDFFNQMTGTMIGVTYGLYGDDTRNPPSPPSFSYYPKYIEVKKEYDESNVRNIYDQLNEGLDYDRFKLGVPDASGLVRGYGESGLKGVFLNPLPPGQLRRDARDLYKYRILPNIDKVKNRRKTTKIKLYDEMRVGKQARLASKSSHISI
jgi:hypothetical protein